MEHDSFNCKNLHDLRAVAGKKPLAVVTQVEVLLRAAHPLPNSLLYSLVAIVQQCYKTYILSSASSETCAKAITNTYSLLRQHGDYAIFSLRELQSRQPIGSGDAEYVLGTGVCAAIKECEFACDRNGKLAITLLGLCALTLAPLMLQYIKLQYALGAAAQETLGNAAATTDALQRTLKEANLWEHVEVRLDGMFCETASRLLPGHESLQYDGSMFLEVLDHTEKPTHIRVYVYWETKPDN